MLLTIKRFHNHFYVNLVFYNCLLSCYLIIDLKIGEIKHQDLGQMQMYVNYSDRYVKTNDVIGLLHQMQSTLSRERF
ncbi:MAG TPA: PDDEXK nuclease domain-containing protein [Chitinispirillaceae bacterium]|nr:PDDEXK nuclease domain-containing protein [Chitinispirillaceae bacterium]